MSFSLNPFLLMCVKGNGMSSLLIVGGLCDIVL